MHYLKNIPQITITDWFVTTFIFWKIYFYFTLANVLVSWILISSNYQIQISQWRQFNCDSFLISSIGSNKRTTRVLRVPKLNLLCISSAWCKTIVTTLFYITSYNSFASSQQFTFKTDMGYCHESFGSVRVSDQKNVNNLPIKVYVKVMIAGLGPSLTQEHHLNKFVEDFRIIIIMIRTVWIVMVKKHLKIIFLNFVKFSFKRSHLCHLKWDQFW